MKMTELKSLSIKNQGQSLKSFTQPKLSFSKAVAAKKDSPIQSTNKEESQVPTANEDGKSNSGRFYKKLF